MKTTSLLTLALISSICQAEWYTETLYDHYGQSFKIEKKLYEDKTDLQHLIVFNNKQFGTVLALDGIIQTTQLDEFVYHEMMTHVPILAHGNVKKVLIIGGGDGGSLREVLRHKTVEKAVMVEIDQEVITMSKQFLPTHSNGAFDDPRAQIVIADGCKFVKETKEKFDVIICDSSDAVGPNQVLFTQEFYTDCHNCLNENGIFTNHSGVPFMQADVVRETQTNLHAAFKHVAFYIGVVPTYIGGFMIFSFATDNATINNVSTETITERMKNISGALHYYTPEIHHASFVLPKFIKDILADA